MAIVKDEIFDPVMALTKFINGPHYYQVGVFPKAHCSAGINIDRFVSPIFPLIFARAVNEMPVKLLPFSASVLCAGVNMYIPAPNFKHQHSFTDNVHPPTPLEARVNNTGAARSAGESFFLAPAKSYFLLVSLPLQTFGYFGLYESKLLFAI